MLAAGPITDAMLGAEAGESWLHTSNYSGHRFNTLTAINATNAKDLKLVDHVTGGKTDSAGNTEYDGLLYFPQDNQVFAIDAGTSIVWKYAQTAGRLGRLQRLFLHWQAPRRGNLREQRLLPVQRRQAARHRPEDRQAKWVSPTTGSSIRRISRKRTPMDAALPLVDGHCRRVIVPMNATDTGGLAGYVLGVSPETGEMLWKAR
jgi:hypothetical protein